MKCRGCGAVDLELVVSLGDMPPVNAFLTAAQVEGEQRFALDCYFCEHCTLVQLDPIVDPGLLFSDYAYLSSVSQTAVSYLTQLAGTLANDLNVTASSKVLEIGSNDGTFLAQLRRYTAHVMGVDPARNVVEKAEALGLRTVVDFFSAKLADSLQAELGQFDLIVALNVVAHTPNFLDLFEGVKQLLHPHGYFVMEAADVVQTILRGEIDTIYHEHVYCFSLHALKHACQTVGLTIVDACKTPAQGGSLRVFMQATSNANVVSPRVLQLLEDERSAGLTRFAAYAPVAGLARDLRERLRAGLHQLRQAHDTVVGLGAPARGVVLMNYCELTCRDLDFVVDDAPTKQGKLVPGRHIPVFGWTKIAKDGSIGCLMLSWNYRREILAKLRARTANATVLVPLPSFEQITLA
ncbi:MAG TPA: class I SAM-dependent methyltransferase [Polyangiaceae bacterium]|nr:class I SAM-dependent methyltransferase [Polyangiaceae bacterium]